MESVPKEMTPRPMATVDRVAPIWDLIVVGGSLYLIGATRPLLLGELA